MLQPYLHRTPVAASLASHHAGTYSGTKVHDHGTLALGSGALKLVFIMAHLTSAGARTIASVTVAGNAATEIIPLFTQKVGSDYSYMAVYGIIDAVNTSGDIVVTWGQNMSGSEIAVFSLANASLTPAGSDTTQDSPISFADLRVGASGAIVAVASSVGDNGVTWTWSGLTERYDGASGVGSWTMSAAVTNFASGVIQSVTATPSGSPSRVMGAALAFSPLR
jgi:hypothetical protein